jgi:uncharacterized membrane protein YebE (DUF533 family)
MIDNFEKITCRLSEYEKNILLPAVVEILKACQGKAKAITNKRMIRLHLQKYAVNPIRLRKVLHRIRTEGMVEGLMASSKGYYVADNREELEKYVASLEGRIRAQQHLRDNIKKQLGKMFPA